MSEVEYSSCHHCSYITSISKAKFLGLRTLTAHNRDADIEGELKLIRLRKEGLVQKSFLISQTMANKSGILRWIIKM